MKLTDSFSNRVKLLRKKNNLWQWQLAEKIGIYQGAVSAWETGANPLPSIDMLLKLSDFFNCSTDYLLGLTNNPERNE